MTPRKLLLLLSTLALMAAVAGCSLGGVGTRTFTVQLSDSAGLFTGNDVGVLGVPIGTVTDITPEGDHVNVTLEVTDDSVKLPADANVAVVARSVATDRYVELTPRYSSGPQLKDGATIPKERTVTPVDFDKVIASVDRLGRGLVNNKAATNSLREVIGIGAETLHGKGAQINRTLASLSEAVRGVSRQSDDIFGAMDSLDRLSRALVRNEATLRRFVRNVADATQLLASERRSLGRALTSLSAAADDVAAFSRRHRSQIRRDTTDLTAVVGSLARARGDLAEIVQSLPLATDNLTRTRSPQGNLRVRAELAEAMPLVGSQLVEMCDNAGTLCSGLSVPPNFEQLLAALFGERR